MGNCRFLTALFSITHRGKVSMSFISNLVRACCSTWMNDILFLLLPHHFPAYATGSALAQPGKALEPRRWFPVCSAGPVVHGGRWQLQRLTGTGVTCHPRGLTASFWATLQWIPSLHVFCSQHGRVARPPRVHDCSLVTRLKLCGCPGSLNPPTPKCRLYFTDYK